MYDRIRVMYGSPTSSSSSSGAGRPLPGSVPSFMSSASDAAGPEDASSGDDGPAVPSMRPAPLAVPLDASIAASNATTAFTPIAAITPGKPSFRPKLALQLVPEDATSTSTSTSSPIPTTAASSSASSPSSPTAAAGADNNGKTVSSDRVVVAGRTTNTTFREDQFEIRHSSFMSASRRASTNTRPTSSTASPAASPATSSPSTPPQQLLSLSSSTLTTLSVLGRGASATVLKCRHTPTGRLIALKCIDVSSTHNRHQLVKELREYDSAAYTSPYFVEWYGAYYENAQVRIGLEYMDRGGLDGVVKRYGGLSDERLIANIMRQALLALSQLHANHKIHRDIKPANFLLHSSGTVKCADFGLLAQLESTLSQRQTFTGTVLYMSPERLSSEEYGVGADVWSLGMTALVLDGGKHPLEATMRDGGYFAVMAEVAGSRMKNGSGGSGERQDMDGVEKEEAASGGLKTDSGSARRWEDALSAGRSEPMRDFIRCCLNPDPEQRHTANQLLSHPFITAAPDNTAALPLWPAELRMGEVEADDETSVGGSADEVGMGEWQRRASGKEWIRQSMIGNARKERDRRKAAGSIVGVSAAIVSPPDDLSSLQGGGDIRAP